MSLASRIRRNIGELASLPVSPKDHRRRITRRYLHDGLRGLVPYIGTEYGDEIFFSATRDRTVGRSLYTSGMWDPEGLEKVIDRAGLDLSHGKLVVEVGANIGTTTVQAARMGARVIAFEPEPINFRLLRANLAVNALDQQVVCVNAACSSTAGIGRMKVSHVNDGDHRVSTDGTLEIQLVRLDDALAVNDLPLAAVGLLWMDTQGHEADVMAGAEELLRFRPPILSEFWPAQLGSRWEDFRDAVAHYSRIIDMTTGNETNIEDARLQYSGGQTDLLII